MADNGTFFTKTIVKPLHSRLVRNRRVGLLSRYLSALLPREDFLTGLDVGCGNGEVMQKIKANRLNVKIIGLDVTGREGAALDIIKFDGCKMPFKNKSFDFTMLIDVLHHADDPMRLIQECVRVSRKFILLKDHICETRWDRKVLRFMDWVGNRGYNVNLPYSYFSNRDWERLFKIYRLTCEARLYKLNFYPRPFSFLFGRNLNFAARLSIGEQD